ncbi:hypothetical protein BDN72DRAFT_253989 [Pluteus cervinus]|uniref:Uncharacterized protein n=1 Tax=Pluteus cervinus TaxID=181527 RepID=A0ACD3AGC9_9AGAR|nr:hypothetical protein BDN72DRAFT_253989 [Pluteus cervinus]
MSSDIDEHDTRKAIQVYEAALVRLEKEADALQERVRSISEQESQNQPDDSVNSPLSGLFRPLSALGIFNIKTDPSHKTLDSIMKERKEIERQLLLHKHLVSGAQFIPAEIWSEIFLLCRPEDDEFVRWGTIEDPRRLAAVCKQWQNIINATPQLWSSLSLHIHQSFITAQQGILRVWLERTRAAPVSLELIWYPKAKGGIHTDNAKWFIDNIYNIISPSAFRWQRLSLSLPEISVVHILRENLPQLVHLSITTTSTELVPSPISRAPALCSLSIPGVYKHPLTLGMPWSQFTTLHSHYPLSLADATQFLALCTNLQHCRIRICISTVENVHARGPLVMPKMVSFTFLFKVNEPIAAIIDSFAFPNLQTLEILGTITSSSGGLFPKANILALLTRSRCTITTLRGRGLPMPEGVDMDFVEGIPTLLVLELAGSRGDVVTPEAHRILQSRNGTESAQESDQPWVIVPKIGVFM